MSTWRFNEFIYAHIMTRAWLNEDFKKRLLENPDEVLKANGFALPRRVKKAKVKIDEGIKEASWDLRYRILTLPLPPPSMSPADLLVCDIDEVIIGLPKPPKPKPTPTPTNLHIHVTLDSNLIS